MKKKQLGQMPPKGRFQPADACRRQLTRGVCQNAGSRSSETAQHAWVTVVAKRDVKWRRFVHRKSKRRLRGRQIRKSVGSTGGCGPLDVRFWLSCRAGEQCAERLRQNLTQATGTALERAVLQHAGDVDAIARACERHVQKPFDFLTLAQAFLLVHFGDERTDRYFVSG